MNPKPLFCFVLGLDQTLSIDTPRLLHADRGDKDFKTTRLDSGLSDGF